MCDYDYLRDRIDLNIKTIRDIVNYLEEHGFIRRETNLLDTRRSYFVLA